MNKDIFIGTVYFSPTGNKENVLDKYHALTEDISYFQDKGYIILQGDFNAHTNKTPDFIEYDEHIGGMGGENFFFMPPRNSEDNKKADMRGVEVLELCKSLNVIIVNGRKTGDPFGKITSFQCCGLCNIFTRNILTHKILQCWGLLPLGIGSLPHFL